MGWIYHGEPFDCIQLNDLNGDLLRYIKKGKRIFSNFLMHGKLITYFGHHQGFVKCMSNTHVK